MKNVIIIIIVAACIQGCYYDDPDILDPNRSVCDTTIITYSGTITPILTAYCSGCHSGANAPAGVTTDNYTGVKAIASSGKLLGTITHSPGFAQMPKNGAMLNSCSIAKIRKWITAGTPNN
jgi:hypothetical protein